MAAHGVSRAAQQQPIDLVIGRGAWQLELITRAVEVEVGGLVLPIAGAADLILLKLYAGGTQDRWDIVQLLATGAAELRAEVESRLSALPARCRELWDKVLTAA